MFDGKKCKLCKECVLIVGEEQMQENDNQASIGRLHNTTLEHQVRSETSTTPQYLRALTIEHVFMSKDTPVEPTPGLMYTMCSRNMHRGPDVM